VPANAALQLMVNSHEGKKPSTTWMRPSGRPRCTWLNHIQGTDARPLSTIWRSQVARGHGGAQRSVRTSRWWWWWWWDVGWEKVACWSTKAAISLKRVKIKEKLLWRAYRKSQTLFRTIHTRPPTPFPFPRLGVRNPTPKLQSLLCQERLKLRTSNLAIHSQGPSEHKPMKNFWERERIGVSRDCPNFFEYPLLSQERVKLRTSNFVCTFLVSIGTKAHYKFPDK